MLKYHVAVCDDEKSDLDGIVQSVQQYDVQGCFDIETYMDGNELLSELQMLCVSYGCCRSLRFKSQVLLSVMWHSIMLRMSISRIIWSVLWRCFSL